MAWMRKVYTNRKTRMLSLPAVCCTDMGLSDKSEVLLEHPFTDAIIITSGAVRESVRGEAQCRSVGWLLESSQLERNLLVVQRRVDDGYTSCDVCRRWEKEFSLGLVGMCRWCAREIGFAIAMRQRPVQAELDLLAASSDGRTGGTEP